MMNYYGTTSNEPTELELRGRALARRAAAEGFVLLKNDGALPLKSKKIALYGMGARMTVKGGLGSGSVEERYSVNIEDGLKNAGYEITTQKWLDDYDEEYRRTYQEYHDMVEEKVAGLADPMEIIPLAHSFVYRYPSGRDITVGDVAASDTDTALYVITRQAGECNDRKLEPGDYYITDTERENLKTVGLAYDHTILIINVGGHIDLGFLDEIKGINAVVLFVQSGEEGGNALADVLSGRENFSGKLADTIPLRFEDIPFGGEFSYLNGDLDDEYYKEGIYVGYRYFDSFRKPVRFPFGFGLSYTSFAVETEAAELDGDTVHLRVRVDNTGTVPGREVVQVYLSAPQGTRHKEYQRLVAFAKTETLALGASQTLELSFPLADGASYDEARAAWVLDAGFYLIRVGNSSRDTAIAAVVELPTPVVTRQCRNCCAAVDELPEFVPGDIPEEVIPDSVPVLPADPAAFVAEVIDYTEPQVTETDQETVILDGLTTEEQAWFLQGGALRNPPAGALDIPGAGGKTVTALLDKGIRNVVFADGPAGVNICRKVKVLPDGRFAAAEVPERYNWGLLAKGMAAQIARLEGETVYRYATAWPVELLLAQTWNAPMLEEIGGLVGEELRSFGVSVWLAPAVNILRNPLGGRTFEYYSEDPVLTGKLASALTRGVQSRPGVGERAKPFCCNNSEDNRNGISANVSERALREIYLKGFEIAVREAQPWTVMSSYNQLNHVYTANRHDLLTDILRCEWGFEGLVMTDWNSCTEHSGDPAKCAPAGNDLIMPGSDFDRQRVLEALADGRLTAADVRRSACRVLRLMLNAHTQVLMNGEESK